MNWLKKIFGRTPKEADPAKKSPGAFFESCINNDFKELANDPEWENLPELKPIIDAGNHGQTDQALQLALDLSKRFPEFEFSYNWLGILYSRKKQFDKAQDAVKKGLRLCRKKVLLINRMGNIYFEEQNIKEAIRWWITSAILQLRFSYDLYETWPHLIVAANALGCTPAAANFEIHAKGRSLVGQTAARIRHLAGLSPDKEELAGAINDLADTVNDFG